MENANINTIIEYIINKYNISKEELNNNINKYINDLLILESIYMCNNVIRIKKEIEELEFDRERLRSSITSRETFESINTGRNNGSNGNKVEMAQIEILKINEEIESLVGEKRNVQASQEVHKKILKLMFNLIPNDTHKLIMELSYIHGLRVSELNKTLGNFYDEEYIKTLKARCRKKIIKKIKSFLMITEDN